MGIPEKHTERRGIHPQRRQIDRDLLDMVNREAADQKHLEGGMDLLLKAQTLTIKAMMDCNEALKKLNEQHEKRIAHLEQVLQ